MVTGRTPVCSSLSLDGIEAANEFTTKDTRQNPTEIVRESQRFFINNHLSNKKTNPTVYIKPIDHKNRFPVLEKGKKRVLESYSNPYKYDFGGMTSYHKDKLNKKGSHRKRRCEPRKFVCGSVTQCILHHVNLSSMRVGFPDKNNKFINLGIEYLANQIQQSLNPDCYFGLSDIEVKIKKRKNYEMVRKKVKILEKLGYITIEPNVIYIKEQEKYRSLSSTIRVNPKLFYDLGLTDEDINEGRKRENYLETKIELQNKSYQFKKDQRETHKNREWKKPNEPKSTVPFFKDLEKTPETDKKRGDPQLARFHLKNILKSLKDPPPS